MKKLARFSNFKFSNYCLFLRKNNNCLFIYYLGIVGLCFGATFARILNEFAAIPAKIHSF